jgi:hypothetical protein
MVNPITVMLALILLVLGLCLWRPNAGRIFLGLFYMVMGLGINTPVALLSPEAYLAMGAASPLSWYRALFADVVAINPTLFVLPIAAFQVAMGALILGAGRRVKVGLLGTILFMVAILPLGTIQLTSLGLILAQGYLLTQEFDLSLLDILRKRFSAA